MLEEVRNFTTPKNFFQNFTPYKVDKKYTIPVKYILREEKVFSEKFVDDEEVMKISEEIIKRNRHVYAELAK